MPLGKDPKICHSTQTQDPVPAHSAKSKVDILPWKDWCQWEQLLFICIIKEFTRNWKDRAIQEIKTKYFYLQAFLLEWQTEKALTACSYKGMRAPWGWKKTELQSSATPPSSGLPADSGGAIMGGFSRQQSRNPLSYWEMDAGKAQRLTTNCD